MLELHTELNFMEHIGTGLANMAAEVLRGAPAQEVPLLAWGLVCGKAVETRTRAVSFNCGILRVEVTDATWCTSLGEMEARFRLVLNKLIPQEAGTRVERIEFVAAQGCPREPGPGATER